MFTKLLKSNNYLDIYIVSRWMYKIGNPVFIRDSDFDRFEELMKIKYPTLTIYNQSYDDDDEPVELLEKYGISDKTFIMKNTNTSRISRYIDVLLDNKSMSIRAVRTIEDAYEWFRLRNNTELIFSIKMDGINIKSLLDTNSGKLLVASSRARKEGSVLRDFTDAVLQKYPQKFKKNYISGSPGILPVYMEGFVDDIGREELNRRYSKNFVNSKTSGLSVLTGGIDSDLIDHLRIYAFSGNEGSSTLSESLTRLGDAGFNTVPYVVDTFIDNGFSSFKTWIEDKQRHLNNLAKYLGIIYDGIVVQINNWNNFEECDSDGLYSSGNIALKFGENGADIYRAKVSSIELIYGEKSKEQYSSKIFVEPFLTSDRKTIRVINGYNLDTIISNGIKAGTEIEIIYQSGCDPILKLE